VTLVAALQRSGGTAAGEPAGAPVAVSKGRGGTLRVWGAPSAEVAVRGSFAVILSGSVHNAARGRVPAIIIAGLSPVTDGGARTGTRNEFIHYIQDTPRQHEIVGPYMK